jgi:hypothetical protein
MTSGLPESAASEPDLDLEWLLKVRTVVARIGEMNLARWWNSNGQLGSQGGVGPAPRIAANALLRAGPVGLHGCRSTMRTNLRPSWIPDALASDRSA